MVVAPFPPGGPSAFCIRCTRTLPCQSSRIAKSHHAGTSPPTAAYPMPAYHPSRLRLRSPSVATTSISIRAGLPPGPTTRTARSVASAASTSAWPGRGWDRTQQCDHRGSINPSNHAAGGARGHGIRGEGVGHGVREHRGQCPRSGPVSEERAGAPQGRTHRRPSPRSVPGDEVNGGTTDMPMPTRRGGWVRGNHAQL